MNPVAQTALSLGRITVLIGPNGAGKTELIQDIPTYTPPSGDEALARFEALKQACPYAGAQVEAHLNELFPAGGRSSSGFLLTLFYLILAVSPDTPEVFAVENAGAGLNPALAPEVLRRMGFLARDTNRRFVFTTHNPAWLDGLNLWDEDQVLYVVERKSTGEPRARRVSAPCPLSGGSPLGDSPVRLSEAFLRGYIGGLARVC